MQFDFDFGQHSKDTIIHCYAGILYVTLVSAIMLVDQPQSCLKVLYIADIVSVDSSKQPLSIVSMTIITEFYS